MTPHKVPGDFKSYPVHRMRTHIRGLGLSANCEQPKYQANDPQHDWSSISQYVINCIDFIRGQDTEKKSVTVRSFVAKPPVSRCGLDSQASMGFVLRRKCTNMRCDKLESQHVKHIPAGRSKRQCPCNKNSPATALFAADGRKRGTGSAERRAWRRQRSADPRAVLPQTPHKRGRTRVKDLSHKRARRCKHFDVQSAHRT
jgi:hypothetical protein